jgi:hypothetical protein
VSHWRLLEFFVFFFKCWVLTPVHGVCYASTLL